MLIGPPLGDLYILAARVMERSVTEESALARARTMAGHDITRERLEVCHPLLVDLAEHNEDHA
ncbi:hypothetical protein [Streptomyces triticirhizae]|uniref:hypothetical protein n=1 Tax=Streptomyces triticirhizae TaxID=2483353 RepID=UPI0013152313|nr:hypothetical protein [Streptomyces triticirhizae]